MSDIPRRHLIIPDTQLRPGVPTEHIGWAASAAVDYKPDVIMVMGDWWDLPSLSMHDAPGSKEAEGRRVRPDIDIGNEAFERFWGPIKAEMDRVKRNKQKLWNPERHFLFGNHEDRLTRAICRDPKFDGLLSLADLKTPGFQRHDYQRIVNIDGIRYCHLFPNVYSGRPIGGTIVNRLNHIGGSFVQGHQQGFLYASKQYPDHVKHGLVAGRYYQHHETYRAEDVQNSEWSGLVVLNEVVNHNGNGTYDLMPLSISYLSRRYGA